ncbi:hypothetical protein DQ04_02471050 [Trypanosoma grayi]|uniref:hypothetical protein n=1 Tax=Trypanosoma grayi TaxID=71804 RepID=UPI0004F463D3|nr:hypothetical protein DQ04_02471050 [Trypanosoma grayi]KEG11578.1 hypothetical protein DQ04_02471050 [Trypanosoma grayi]
MSLKTPRLLPVLLLLLLLLHACTAYAAGDYPWQTLPPTGPGNTGPIVYPPDTVHYARMSTEPHKPAFFTRAWYFGLILMVFGMLGVYLVLGICVQLHFRGGENGQAMSWTESTNESAYECSEVTENPLDYYY